MENMITIEGNSEFCISAKELHEKLQAKRRFDHWIVNRIASSKLIENVHYMYAKNTSNTLVNYYLTNRGALHICMREKTILGAKLRDWFMDREEKLRSIENTKPNVSLSIVESITLILKSGQEMLRVAQEQEQFKLELDATRKLAIQANSYNAGKTDYYTIRGFAKITNEKVTTEEAKEIAYIARRLSKENDIEVKKCNDERYGSVNLYHESMLQAAFDEWLNQEEELELL